MKTAECEGIEATGALLDRACAARVESVEPIPHSHNVKAVVDAGRYGVQHGGLRRAQLPRGPDHRLRAGRQQSNRWRGKPGHAGQRGRTGDQSRSHRHPRARGPAAVPPGAPLPGCVPDSVIEIDNKSITHRPDLWGHHGMAREVAAILGRKLKDPVRAGDPAAGAGAIQIAIEDYALCPRYSALVFEGVDTRPSPLWLQYRLTAIGLNPINNIVDMTNFVMAELAQPMHAFDADLLAGDTIFIRRARAGERLRALNGEEYTLTPANLVIADASGPIALAGVIGGMDTSISGKTRRVVLESANFNASSIRRTSAALKLRTDASIRFEKAQDPANTVRGLARALDLLQEVSPGIRVVGGVADQMKAIPAPPPIDLPLDWLESKLGRAVETAEVRRILESLAFGVSRDGAAPVLGARALLARHQGCLHQGGPGGRGGPHGRVRYHYSPGAAVPHRGPPANEGRKFQHEARQIFIDLGFTEVYKYSFISEESALAFGFDPAGHVRVGNPIASDQALMRTSLLPGIRHNVLENGKHRDAFRVFEIGMRDPRPAGRPAGRDPAPGRRHLRAAMATARRACSS